MDEPKQRWGKGLELMRYAKQRARSAQEPREIERGRVGRPKAREIAHEALSVALMGLAKA